MTCTLLCYGDSNTHGTKPMTQLEDLGRFAPDVRWPGVLAAALGAGWRVVEEGHPGRTTVHPDPVSGVHKSGIAILPAVLESHRPIDLVALMLGTNDMKARFQVPPVEIATSIETLVIAIRQSFCGPDAGAPAVLVICPPPVLEAGCLAEIFGGGAARSARLAGFLEPMVRRQGAAFLDAGAVIVSSALDGVHYDDAEHGKLGRAVADAVLAMVPLRGSDAEDD